MLINFYNSRKSSCVPSLSVTLLLSQRGHKQYKENSTVILLLNFSLRARLESFLLYVGRKQDHWAQNNYRRRSRICSFRVKIIDFSTTQLSLKAFFHLSGKALEHIKRFLLIFFSLLFKKQCHM